MLLSDEVSARCDLCSASADQVVELRVCRACLRDLAGDPTPTGEAATATATPRPRPLLTLREAATLLHCSPRTLRRFITDGRLRALDLSQSSSPNGRRWRIRYRDLKRLQAELTYHARTG